MGASLRLCTEPVSHQMSTIFLKKQKRHSPPVPPLVPRQGVPMVQHSPVGVTAPSAGSLLY